MWPPHPDKQGELSWLQADCSAIAESLEEEIAAKEAELADVTAEQQAREAQATDLDRQIADTERRLQVWHARISLCTNTHVLWEHKKGPCGVMAAPPPIASMKVLVQITGYGRLRRDMHDHRLDSCGLERVV